MFALEFSEACLGCVFDEQRAVEVARAFGHGAIYDIERKQARQIKNYIKLPDGEFHYFEFLAKSGASSTPVAMNATVAANSAGDRMTDLKDTHGAARAVKAHRGAEALHRDADEQRDVGAATSNFHLAMADHH